MRTRTKIIVGGIVSSIVVLSVYAYRSHVKCKQRGDLYKARIDGIERSVAKLTIGAPKDVVVTFAKENDIDMHFGKLLGADEARGTIHMVACSPGWYCGDSALIGVVVTFDESGRIQNKQVITLFDNCL